MPGVLVAKGFVGYGRHLLQALLEEGIDDLFLVRKPPVCRADSDASMMGDVVERDVQSVFREQLAGGSEQTLAVDRGILSQRTGSGLGHDSTITHKRIRWHPLMGMVE